MQVPFRQHSYQISTRLAAISSPAKLRRYLPDSLYLSTAVAAGLLWLALSGFFGG